MGHRMGTRTSNFENDMTVIVRMIKNTFTYSHTHTVSSSLSVSVKNMLTHLQTHTQCLLPVNFLGILYIHFSLVAQKIYVHFCFCVPVLFSQFSMSNRIPFSFVPWRFFQTKSYQ